MQLAIDKLLADGPPDDERVASFVRDNRFPVVEGKQVTFLYRGAADAVHLRHFIFGIPASQPFQRVDGSDLWYLVMELPECSRVEYKLERVVGDRHEWIMDPLNPNVAHDPFGANSVCHGAGYVTPEWTQPDPEARQGSFEQLALGSRVFGGMRRLRVYLPARFRRTRRYPLLLVHDGEDYVRFAEFKLVLDNLIHRLEIRPMIVALTQSPDRLREYAADPRHARHLVEEVVPALEARYPLVPQPVGRALVGASFGAVAALHTAWSHPGFFRGLLLQSGSFAFFDIGTHGRGPVFDKVATFINQFRREPGRPSERVFVSCGMYESLIYENRSLVPLLQATGMDVRYVEARDGHNWDNWRDRLREALSWLFPGPLWMIYE